MYCFVFSDFYIFFIFTTIEKFKKTLNKIYYCYVSETIPQKIYIYILKYIIYIDFEAAFP